METLSRTVVGLFSLHNPHRQPQRNIYKHRSYIIIMDTPSGWDSFGCGLSGAHGKVRVRPVTGTCGTRGQAGADVSLSVTMQTFDSYYKMTEKWSINVWPHTVRSGQRPPYQRAAEFLLMSSLGWGRLRSSQEPSWRILSLRALCVAHVPL